MPTTLIYGMTSVTNGGRSPPYELLLRRVKISRVIQEPVLVHHRDVQRDGFVADLVVGFEGGLGLLELVALDRAGQFFGGEERDDGLFAQNDKVGFDADLFRHLSAPS